MVAAYKAVLIHVQHFFVALTNGRTLMGLAFPAFVFSMAYKKSLSIRVVLHGVTFNTSCPLYQGK